MVYIVKIERLHPKFKYPVGKPVKYTYKNKEVALRKIKSICKRKNIAVSSNISHEEQYKYLNNKC